MKTMTNIIVTIKRWCRVETYLNFCCIHYSFIYFFVFILLIAGGMLCRHMSISMFIHCFLTIRPLGINTCSSDSDDKSSAAGIEY